MSLDQHIYGSSEWHLPSPSSTPKSATFPEAVLETPKTAEPTHSHFLDAFHTPQLNGHQTPLQTPITSSACKVDRLSSSCGHKGLSPEDPQFHVNYFSSNTHLPLPPVEPSRRLSSSPDPLAVKDKPVGTPVPKLLPAVDMDHSQMRTPPPTRGSSTSKRRGLNASGFGQRTSSTARAGPLATPTGPAGSPENGLLFHTPLQFSSFQFSPDLGQFHSNGTASAPPQPPGRLFWNPGSNSNAADATMGNAAADDPFGPVPLHAQGIPDWQIFGPPMDQAMQSQSFQSDRTVTGNEPPAVWNTSSAGAHGVQSFSQAGSFVSTSSGVDPSLLFSFSHPLDALSDTSIAPNMFQPSMDPEGRQPYEQQTRESMREREMTRMVKQQYSRPGTASNPSSLPDHSRPGLRRSFTDGGFRRVAPPPSECRSVSNPHIPRRSSPLKRQAQAPLTSIPEATRPRPRIRLVVGEDGRARTEPAPAEDMAAVDKLSESSYPSVWNDDSDSDLDLDFGYSSRSSSYAYAAPTIRRRTKHARNESGADLSNPFKVPRPSSSASLSSLSLAGLKRNGSRGNSERLDRSLSNTFRRFSMSSFGAADEKNGTKARTTKDPHDGDAQNALKRLVEDRMKRKENAANNTLEAHNKRWSQASSELPRLGTQHRTSLESTGTNFAISPVSLTEADLATPSTDRSSLSSEGTRCVCNSTDGDGGLMIQCESCTKWLHVRCVGLNAQRLPPVFVCVFCTGQTPVARGGRIRGPFNTLASPLHHKSTYRS